MAIHLATTHFDDIGLYGKSVEELLQQDDFPDRMFSLIELVTNYHNPNSNLAELRSKECVRNERVADIVDTSGAEERGRFLRLKYTMKPTDMRQTTTKEYKSGKETVKYRFENGSTVVYDCPPKGFRIPADGLLWHPQTGTALDTTVDREKAVASNAAYIEKHPEQFSHIRIPRMWHTQFSEKFKDFNPLNPTPEHLGDFITSFQGQPKQDSGIGAVILNGYTREGGSFEVCLGGDVLYKGCLTGARYHMH